VSLAIQPRAGTPEDSQENAKNWDWAVDFADECGTLNSSPMCSVRSATTSGLGTDLRWRTVAAQRARTATRIDPFRSCGCRLNRPS